MKSRRFRSTELSVKHKLLYEPKALISLLFRLFFIYIVVQSWCVLRCSRIQYKNKFFEMNSKTVIEMKGSWIFFFMMVFRLGCTGKSVKPPYGAYPSRVGIER